MKEEVYTSSFFILNLTSKAQCLCCFRKIIGASGGALTLYYFPMNSYFSAKSILLLVTTIF